MARTGSRRSVLSPDVLQAALAGLEAQRSRVDSQIAQVRWLLDSPRRGRPTAAAAQPDSADSQPKKRRKMSAAARKRIAAAQKKRWAAFRKQQTAK